MTALDSMQTVGDERAGVPARVATGWLVAQLAAERDRWALWLPVMFAAGIGLYFALAREPAAWTGALALVAALGMCVVARRSAGPLLLALGVSVAAAGFTTAQVRTALVAAPVLDQRIGPVQVIGRVAAVEPRAAGVRLTLSQPRIAGLAPVRTPARIRVTVNGKATSRLDGPAPGAWVALRAVLRPPPEPVAPGAYDFARRAYFQGIGAVGFAYGRARIVAPPEGGAARRAGTGFGGAWDEWWADLRAGTARRVMAALPGDTGAVAAALMTGERGMISPRVMAAMRDSGLAHLLAISGLHMGLVAGLLFLGLRAAMAAVPRLALTRPIKKWAAVGALVGAFAYLELTGGTVPTQRAFLMVGLVLLAVMLDRTALSPRLVAWAASAVLALAPESLLSASFQLSFAAVAALIAAYETVRERRYRSRTDLGLAARAGLYVGGVALTSLVAGLATAPFAIYHFNRVAWYGLAANLIAVPLTALWIMPWAVAAFCLMPFGLERLALVPMGWGIDAMIRIAEAVAAWPGAVSVVPAMPTAGLIAIALGGVWLCIWRRSWRLAGLVPIAAGVLSALLIAPPDILVSGDGRLFAVRPPGGSLLLSTGAARRFDADIWRRRAGAVASAPWPHDGSAIVEGLRCDRLGCIYRRAGQTVALVEDGRALAEDCAVASVVIARVPIRRGTCPGPGVRIDRFDLWRAGAHGLWLLPGRVRVQTVAAWRGARPWVRQRPR